jgi:hypothetical protein
VNAAAMSGHAALAADDQHGWAAAIAGVGAAAGGSTTATATAAAATPAAAASAPLRMQHFMAQDYAGLLQDMFPPFVHSSDGGHHHHHH